MTATIWVEDAMSEPCGSLRLATGVAVISGLLAAGCEPPRVPDENVAPLVVQVAADRQWTETALHVHRVDWLDFTATGDIFWELRRVTAGPDGIGGSPGWLKTGGLIGSVSGTAKTFELGARTTPLPYRDPRSRATYPPPPVRMPADGTLRLGFKDYQGGANHGNFTVTIRRAREP